MHNIAGVTIRSTLVTPSAEEQAFTSVLRELCDEHNTNCYVQRIHVEELEPLYELPDNCYFQGKNATVELHFVEREVVHIAQADAFAKAAIAVLDARDIIFDYVRKGF